MLKEIKGSHIRKNKSCIKKSGKKYCIKLDENRIKISRSYIKKDV